MLQRQVEKLDAVGQIAMHISDIRALMHTLQQLPLWRPAQGLEEQCREALKVITDMQERLEHKLVVTIIGPSGSGKSTLLNALAGGDAVSATGTARPTTRSLVAVCQAPEDARQLVQHLGEEHVHIKAHAVEALENLILVDTPDTDSTLRQEHIPILHQAITLSDVLLCVFDAENPKRRDHTDFLAPYVQSFSGESLVVTVNKCDRQAEDELLNTILPEFSGYIENAWDKSVSSILCISGRSHLRNPAWDPQAMPRHTLDQFETLQQLLTDQFQSAGFSVDRRIANAAELRTYIYNAVHKAVSQDQKGLKDAARKIMETESDALNQAVEALKMDQRHHLLGINVMLYQRLAQRWMGPVGWLIAVWTRLLVFGAGFSAMLRFGNPLRQLWGLFSSLRHYKTSSAAVEHVQEGHQAASALRNYHAALAIQWPDIAELLIDSHFDVSVRDSQAKMVDENRLEETLATQWRETLDAEIERCANALSGFVLQLLFNLPGLGILGYVGWLTARDFLAGTILPSDFFLHAFITIVIVLFLSFFLFQICLRIFASNTRISRRAFDRLKQRIDAYPTLSDSPIGQQIATILNLAD
jgi:tRNA U34 5-carboxymethylaminomethyl modifying GTPase MnmE/TrmE